MKLFQRVSLDELPFGPVSLPLLGTGSYTQELRLEVFGSSAEMPANFSAKNG